MKLRNSIKKYNIYFLDLYIEEHELIGIERSNEFIDSFLLLEKTNISSENFIFSFIRIFKKE